MVIDTTSDGVSFTLLKNTWAPLDRIRAVVMNRVNPLIGEGSVNNNVKCTVSVGSYKDPAKHEGLQTKRVLDFEYTPHDLFAGFDGKDFDWKLVDWQHCAKIEMLKDIGPNEQEKLLNTQPVIVYELWFDTIDGDFHVRAVFDNCKAAIEPYTGIVEGGDQLSYCASSKTAKDNGYNIGTGWLPREALNTLSSRPAITGFKGQTNAFTVRPMFKYVLNRWPSELSNELEMYGVGPDYHFWRMRANEALEYTTEKARKLDVDGNFEPLPILDMWKYFNEVDSEDTYDVVETEEVIEVEVPANLLRSPVAIFWHFGEDGLIDYAPRQRIVLGVNKPVAGSTVLDIWALACIVEQSCYDNDQLATLGDCSEIISKLIARSDGRISVQNAGSGKVINVYLEEGDHGRLSIPSVHAVNHLDGLSSGCSFLGYESADDLKCLRDDHKGNLVVSFPAGNSMRFYGETGSISCAVMSIANLAAFALSTQGEHKEPGQFRWIYAFAFMRSACGNVQPSNDLAWALQLKGADPVGGLVMQVTPLTDRLASGNFQKRLTELGLKDGYCYVLARRNSKSSDHWITVLVDHVGDQPVLRVLHDSYVRNNQEIGNKAVQYDVESTYQLLKVTPLDAQTNDEVCTVQAYGDFTRTVSYKLVEVNGQKLIDA